MINNTIPKENMEKTSPIEAFFAEEARFRLSDVFNLSNKCIEENHEMIAKVFYENVHVILDYDVMDNIIRKELNVD